MAVFTMTVTDPNGVDLKYFLPGNMAIRALGGSYNPTAGNYFYREIVNGVIDEDIAYRTSWTGTNIDAAFGDNGLVGNMTSATLEHYVDGAYIQIAQLAITLGDITATVPGIPVSGTLALTPDTLMRLAWRADSDRALLVLNGAAGNDTLPGSNFTDSILGGGGADLLTGYDDRDTLNGGDGADTMIGGRGDDTFIIDASDTIVERPNEGSDTVNSALTYTLLGNFENLKLTGGANRNGAGNSADNAIVGNSGANLLAGRDGADSLNGGDGADTLNGGAGEDVLNGAGGADVFVFDTSRTAGNTDTISNFGFGDKIHLDNAIFSALGASLSADEFRVGTSAQDANDYVIYNPNTGALYYDHNGSASGGAFRIATMPTSLALAHTDFLVI